MWGWKEGLLPETNFSRDIQKLLNQAKRGDLRSANALDEMGANNSEPVKAAEARQAQQLLRMILKLEGVSDRSIRDHLRTAVLASDKVASGSARAYLLRVADPGESNPARFSAQAALDFLKLRLEWSSLI